MALSNQLQHRRGTEEQHRTFVGSPGEITVVTTKNIIDGNPEYPVWELRVHDGSTPGGYRIPTYNIMEEYLQARKIGFNNLESELKNKIEEINTKLSKSDADNLYRSVNTAINLNDLSIELSNLIKAPNSSLEAFKSNLLSNDNNNRSGSSLVGYYAKFDNFGSEYEQITTVKDALDNLSLKVNTNKSTIEALNTNMNDLRVSNNLANQNISDLLNRVNIVEPKVSNLEVLSNKNKDDIIAVNNSLVEVSNKNKDYTDLAVTNLNSKITELNTNLTNLNEDVYKKDEIDKFNQDFNTKDTELTNSLNSVTNRVSVIEENRYTKLETDSEIKKAIDNLIGGAPAQLDTLKELAEALQNDANFSSTITAQLANKANLDDFNTLNDIVTNEDTGLVLNINNLKNELNTTNTKLNIVDRYVNGYEQVPGLMDRVGTIESALGLGGADTLEELKNRIKTLEETIIKHGIVLDNLHDVATSGKYNDLIGTPIIPKGYYTGSNTFNGKVGCKVMVPANYQSVGNTYNVLISPKSNPMGNLGEIWIDKKETYFMVYCSGETRTTKFDYAIFNNDSRVINNTEGGAN